MDKPTTSGSRGTTVEGEKLSEVVRRSRFKGTDTDDEDQTDKKQNEGETTKRNEDDDYVLSKLFRNNNVHSVSIKRDVLYLDAFFSPSYGLLWAPNPVNSLLVGSNYYLCAYYR